MTTVAISFMVKRLSGARDKKAARVYYFRRPELETAEEKLGFLANHPMRKLDFVEVQPDKTGNWVNLTSNDFETLLPVGTKEAKALIDQSKAKTIFKLFSLGASSNRDDWAVDLDKNALVKKA